MSIDASEKREQTLQLHANVLQAEQERIDGAPTLSVSEARKQLRERMKMYNVKWRTYSNINYETIVILCNWVDGLKNVSPSHKFYLSTFFIVSTI